MHRAVRTYNSSQQCGHVSGPGSNSNETPSRQSKNTCRVLNRTANLMWTCIMHVSKEYVVKLSGLNKNVYQSHLKPLECMLGLETQMGIRDLAVQRGCTEAVNTAVKILPRYESSLPEAQQSGLDLSKLLFTTAALFTACKCMKIKEETATMPKQQKSEESAKQDYEEWKREILENAAKAKKVDTC
ncbi:UNVERIFIED_CONTAM: hypothetical protein FKN15_077130 [Acipenser sinensis]